MWFFLAILAPFPPPVFSPLPLLPACTCAHLWSRRRLMVVRSALFSTDAIHLLPQCLLGTQPGDSSK